VNVSAAPQRVLLIQLADIGDLLLAAPAIRYLRATRPQDRFTLLTKPSNRALAVQLVDEVLTVDKHLYDSPLALLMPHRIFQLLALVTKLRRRRFDEVILLHHLVTRWGQLKFVLLILATGARRRRGLDNGWGWFLTDSVHDAGFGVRHESDYWHALLGGAVAAPPAADVNTATQLLAMHHVERPYMVVHPGSGRYSVARRWPLERFGVVIDELAQCCGLITVVVGGPEERELATMLVKGRELVARNLAGCTDLATLAGLLLQAELFIGNDGGVAQMAASVGTPSVVIFGPSNHRMWGPRHRRSRIVRLDLPCSPCFYRYHELGTPEGCATRECLLSLEPARVIEAALELLRESNAA
jgi:ADP-heptose:LPS heptosyltransferase